MAVQSKARPSRKKKCLRCKRRRAVSRGDCARCLRLTHYEDEQGVRTIAQAIAEGLILPAKKTGRKPLNGRKLAKVG